MSELVGSEVCLATVGSTRAGKTRPGALSHSSSSASAADASTQPSGSAGTEARTTCTVLLACTPSLPADTPALSTTAPPVHSAATFRAESKQLHPRTGLPRRPAGRKAHRFTQPRPAGSIRQHVRRLDPDRGRRQLHIDSAGKHVVELLGRHTGPALRRDRLGRQHPARHVPTRPGTTTDTTPRPVSTCASSPPPAMPSEESAISTGTGAVRGATPPSTPDRSRSTGRHEPSA